MFPFAPARPNASARFAVIDNADLRCEPGGDEAGKRCCAAVLANLLPQFFSTKGVGKGTGLGLSMVHGLAAQLGGGLSRWRARPTKARRSSFGFRSAPGQLAEKKMHFQVPQRASVAGWLCWWTTKSWCE